MDCAALIARMDEQRAQWLDDLPGHAGKRLRVLRPLETDLDQLRANTLRDMAQGLSEFVTDWEGFAEADLVGAAFGSDEVVPFDRALFVRWVRDHTEVVAALGEAIKAAIDAHREAKDQSRKN